MAARKTKATAEVVDTQIKETEKTAEAVTEVAAEPKKRTRRTKKAEATVQIAVQFAGKSYTNEELVKIAKDVWQYDLQKEEKELTGIELYVKPEESMVYYVFNGTIEGKFLI